jgi:leader peptidase (prepilin peptidase)/N-methyltransferase
MIHSIFEAKYWASVPFHFWSVVFFVFGCIVGSFLNVCIYRMPLGLSLISPPSHCPNCKYSIPWYLNIPLVTWLYLGGRCGNCGEAIPVRYLLVELLTGLLFLASWLVFGASSGLLALTYCLLLGGLIVATFIDFAHLIIPDEITYGGAVAGFLCSLALPRLHAAASTLGSMADSLLGIGVGAGLIYGILRAGKLLFGRKRRTLPEDARIVFTETAVHLEGEEIPYEDLFYRQSDVITFHARTLELVDRCYRDVWVRLSPARLWINEEELNPEQVPHMEAVSAEVILPQEAMGLGDVKFMAAIGAFLGWRAVIFSLMVSSMIGALVGVTLIACRRREWSARLPYGPYIAMAAVVWIFGGRHIWEALFPR